MLTWIWPVITAIAGVFALVVGFLQRRAAARAKELEQKLQAEKKDRQLETANRDAETYRAGVEAATDRAERNEEVVRDQYEDNAKIDQALVDLARDDDAAAARVLELGGGVPTDADGNPVRPDPGDGSAAPGRATAARPTGPVRRR